jgi:Ca2+-binding RTX toxin-like protein
MGATITVNSIYDFNIGLPDFSSIYYATSYDYGSTIFQPRYGSQAMEEFRGTDLRYSKGLPIAGTVTSYALSIDGNVEVSIKGISIAATSFVAVGKTSSIDDDASLIAKALTRSDFFSGGSGSDTFNGYAGDDTIYGNVGADFLTGGRGNDILHGGLDQDELNGGSGSDTFLYRSAKESSGNWWERDTIVDFTSEDRIDLSGIDANALTRTNNTFTFIGGKNFHGVAGELRYSTDYTGTYIFGDTNGDEMADFSVHLDVAYMTVQKGFFVL